MKLLRPLLYSLLGAAALSLGFYYGYFLRLPARDIPLNQTHFLSPANGTVILIEPWEGEQLTIEKGARGALRTWTDGVDTHGTLVSIQMTPLNVHYQRLPLTTTLVEKHYVPGNTQNAMSGTTRYENEHNILTFETEAGVRFSVVQIAGAFARRIEDFLTVGETYAQGQVIGLIRLGSQVSVVLPSSLTPTVSLGQSVIDGETVLATLP
ncbi:phosphatidylserine decarboxylase [Candidatus Peribacteria bacterium]|nr:phosphatidylserine decarboxylase [Candidatus Peribacteria bacterium]